MNSPLIHRLEIFRGRKVSQCFDAIGEVAVGYSINLMGYGAPANIDNDNRRLNVRTDEAGFITKFTIG